MDAIFSSFLYFEKTYIEKNIGGGKGKWLKSRYRVRRVFCNKFIHNRVMYL